MPLCLADLFGETRAPGDARPPKRLRAVAREEDLRAVAREEEWGPAYAGI
jgi:hypothetical protein